MHTFLGIDYNVWWFLVFGAVISGYAILDGFDLGAGALHLLLKKEESRRIAINAIGPMFDGNEVWLVIGGGARQRRRCEKTQSRCAQVPHVECPPFFMWGNRTPAR